MFIDGLKEKNVNVISYCLYGCIVIGKFDVVESVIWIVLIRLAVEKTFESIVEEDFVLVLLKLSEIVFILCFYVFDFMWVVELGL